MILCGTVYVTVQCPCVCLSYIRPLQQRAAGLLLWAWRAGLPEILIDRGGRRALKQHGNASSDMFTAKGGG